MEQYKCRYCVYNNYKMNKCTCKYDCLIFGSNAFSQFEEVDEVEHRIRDRYFANREESRKRDNRKFSFHIFTKVISTILAIVIGLGVGIAGIAYRFSHPELTETQLMLWSLENFWPLIVLMFVLILRNFFRRD